MKFDEYYNERPPEVHFYTIPFHPNSKFSFAFITLLHVGVDSFFLLVDNINLVYPWKKPVQDKQVLSRKWINFIRHIF